MDAAYLKKPAHMRTRAERFELGRAMRVASPRESHSQYTVDFKGRKDPVDLLIATGEGRIEELLPIRYGRMMASPFAFFRGAAAIMASDLASVPNSDYAVQACGDCHLMNFGAFATPERNIIFDINDFDETFPAPFEWDLKRLAASFVVASLHNGHKPSEAYAAARRVVECYRDRLYELAEMTALEAWYSYLDYEDLIELTSDSKLKKRRRKVLEKAMGRDNSAEFVKLAHVVEGTPRIKDAPPLVFHPPFHQADDFQERLAHAVREYRQSLSPERRVLFDRYEFCDMAIKVVGVGSVGTQCMIGLFFSAEDDPLFLQLKEARQSVLEPYFDFPGFPTNGERVVFGQRLMQAATDVFLGHFVGFAGLDSYVRQLRDVKVKPMVEIFSAENMLCFARNCGWALARAHARSGDPAIMAGYIGKGKGFPEAIAQFAAAYAKQNARDHSALIEAVRDSRVEAYTEE
ncbi:MAG: DUF2252 domain-containing protein [Cyanobacteria bacterium SZAS LIN-2]|nr:DUF2252 domain-containing protein [Cyanobacteria bacterium SZAS LIN-2]